MGRQSDTLPVDDIRRMLALVNGLHGMPAGGGVRRRHLLRDLCDLLDVDAAESTLMDPTGSAPAVVQTLTVFRDGRRPPRPLLAVGTDGEVHLDPAVPPLLGAIHPVERPVVTRTRRQLCPDRAWYRSDFVQVARHRAGFGDAVYSARRLGPGSPHVAVVCFARRRGTGRPLDKRECHIAHLVHSETAWVYDGQLPGTDARGALSPRQRDCLRHLLDGRSEKEIAARLGLSPHTVHVHVKAVYRQLKVSSRAQLLARHLSEG